MIVEITRAVPSSDKNSRVGSSRVESGWLNPTRDISKPTYPDPTHEFMKTFCPAKSPENKPLNAGHELITPIICLYVLPDRCLVDLDFDGMFYNHVVEFPRVT